MRVGISFYADVKAALKGLNDFEQSVSKLNNTIKKHAGDFQRAGTAITGALGGMLAQATAYGTNIDNMSRATGVAAEDLSRLQFSAERAEVGLGQLQLGVRTLAANMKEARDGSEKQARAFADMGIAVADGAGKLRPFNDVLLDLADYLSAAGGSTDSLAAATEVLGGRAQALIPWLMQGRTELQRNFEQADKLHVTLKGPLAGSLNQLGDNLDDVRAALRGVSVQAIAALTPALKDMTSWLTNVIARFGAMSPLARQNTVEVAALSGATLLLISQIGKLQYLFGAATGPIGLFAAVLSGAIAACRVFDNAARDAAIGVLTLSGAEREAAVASLENKVAIASATAAITGWIQATLAGNPALAAQYTNIEGLSRAIRTEYVTAAQRAIAETIGFGRTGEVAAEIQAKIEAELAKVNARLDEQTRKAKAAAEAAKTYADRWREVGGAIPGTEAPTSFLDTLDNMGASLRTVAADVAPVATQVQALAAPFDYAVTAIERFDTAFHRAVADFGDFLTNEAPNAAMTFTGIADELFTKMAESGGKFLGTLKKAMAAFLRETLMAYVRSKTQELLAARITEIGKALMQGQLNWGALAKLPLIMAAYGAAVAGLSRIKSFKESAIVTRGGEMTGTFHRGDVILGPDAVANLLAGGAGGPSVMVNVTIEGGVNMDRPALAFEMRQLADMIARQWRRG